jgi:hypothetical protein
MRSHIDILNEAYSAFNRRDITAVLTLMNEDIDWPNAMEGIRVFGVEAVRAYWTKQWSLIDPTVTPVRFQAEEDGSVTVDVHQVVRSLDGALLVDQMVQHVYSFQGELIARMDIRNFRTDVQGR